MIAKGTSAMSLTLIVPSFNAMTKLFPSFVMVIGSLGNANITDGSKGGVVILSPCVLFMLAAAAAFNIGEFIMPRPKAASPPTPSHVAAPMLNCAIP